MGRRIVRSSSVMEAKGAIRAEVAPAQPLGQYWDRLKNLIPAEVSAIYIAGLGIIPKEENLGMVIWAAVCLAFVVLFMARQTETVEGDPGERYTPDWVHVAISAISFVIWVYALGGPFVALGIHVAWIGALLMLGWTFVVPYFYEGTAT